MANATNARMRRTRLMWFDPKEFHRQLVEDLFALERRGFKQGKKTACRLNQYSDIAWEKREMLHLWRIQFFDYTKIPYRYARFLAKEDDFANYHLTFSLSENNAHIARGFLDQGGTVAAVYGTQRPDTWHGFPVIDGDEHDLRFLDPPGVVVGLKAKGSMKSQPAFWMENL